MPRRAEKFEIAVIVNGQPVLVETNANAPLQTVVVHALNASGNSGQPPENWELRDEAGNLLDPQDKLSAHGLGPDSKLFLSLKAGVGGSPR